MERSLRVARHVRLQQILSGAKAAHYAPTLMAPTVLDEVLRSRIYQEIN